MAGLSECEIRCRARNAVSMAHRYHRSFAHDDSSPSLPTLRPEIYQNRRQEGNELPEIRGQTELRISKWLNKLNAVAATTMSECPDTKREATCRRRQSATAGKANIRQTTASTALIAPIHPVAHQAQASARCRLKPSDTCPFYGEVRWPFEITTKPSSASSVPASGVREASQ